MPRYRLPELNVAQMQFNPATFQGVGYKPISPDMTILERSLARAEARQKEASEKQSAIDIALGEIEDKLNEAEIPWFTEYKQNIQNQIQQDIDNGNPGSAIRTATRLAGKVANDTQLKERIKYNEARNKGIAEVKANNRYDSITKQRFEAQNTYNYEDRYNDKGEVIGGTEWTPTFTPVDHYAVSDIQRLAAQMTPEEINVTERTTSGSTLGTLDGKKVNNLSSAEVVLGEGNNTTHNEYQRKQEASLRSVVEKLLKEHPEYKASLIQDYENAKWLYSEAKKKANDMSLSEEERQVEASKADAYFEAISDGAGNIIYDVNKYIEQTVFPMMKNMSYNNVVSKTNNGFHYSEGALGAIHQTSINKSLAEIDLANVTTTPGAPVSMNYGNYWTGQTMSSANFNMGVGGIYANEYYKLYQSGRLTREQYLSLTQTQ